MLPDFCIRNLFNPILLIRKSQLLQLQLKAELNEDDLSVLKGNLRNQIIQNYLCSCFVMSGCCRGQLRSLQAQHNFVSGGHLSVLTTQHETTLYWSKCQIIPSSQIKSDKTYI